MDNSKCAVCGSSDMRGALFTNGMFECRSCLSKKSINKPATNKDILDAIEKLGNELRSTRNLFASSKATCDYQSHYKLLSLVNEVKEKLTYNQREEASELFTNLFAEIKARDEEIEYLKEKLLKVIGDN